MACAGRLPSLTGQHDVRPEAGAINGDRPNREAPMLNRGFALALAAIAAALVSVLAATDASALIRVGPHLYPTGQRLLPDVKRGCPGAPRKVKVCTKWYVPHSGGPNRPPPVCISYAWVNKCTS